MSESVCVVDVGSVPSSAGDLPATGSGVPVALGVALAVLLIGAGCVLLVRRALTRRNRAAMRVLTVAGAIALVTAAGVAGVAGAEPAAADAGSCALIDVGDVERASDATNLLPGDEAEVLSYSVTNLADFPVTLTVETAVDDLDAAAHITALLSAQDAGVQAAPALVATGTLAQLPRSADIALPAGESVVLSYAVGVAVDTGDAAQGLAAEFVSTITATGP